MKESYEDGFITCEKAISSSIAMNSLRYLRSPDIPAVSFAPKSSQSTGTQTIRKG
jgi:hypothetical protein